MKYFVAASLFLIGSEVLSMIALLAMLALFCGDILHARMEVGK